MEDSLIASLRTKIADYRAGEINMTFRHVKRWISQFPEEERLSILLGMHHIVDNYYLTKEEAKAYLLGFLQTPEIFGEYALNGIINSEFLTIQERGSSQRDMVDFINEVLEEEFDVTLDYCFSKDTFVYVDDCIYSGNRLRYDLVPWIKEKAPENCNLIVYHFAQYTQGLQYASRYIQRAATEKGITVNYYRHLELDNASNGSIEFFWPKEKEYDEGIQLYINKVNERATEQGYPRISFRPTHIPLRESTFQTKAQRDLMEQAFLREGTRLIQGTQFPAESIRPLGFHKLTTLGFGSLFITYRNIPNNCPLALWYGDPDNYDAPHPFSQWYPLFPRKTNEREWNVQVGEVTAHDLP